MTVEELVEALLQYPRDTEVVIDTNGSDSSSVGAVEFGVLIPYFDDSDLGEFVSEEEIDENVNTENSIAAIRLLPEE